MRSTLIHHPRADEEPEATTVRLDWADWAWSSPFSGATLPRGPWAVRSQDATFLEV